jgi:hypothetical protein
MKYHVKLRARTPARERKKVEDIARKSGASDMRPLFPDSDDGALASLYTVDVAPRQAQSVVERLNALPAVEFVEGEVKRKLKLP